MSKTNKIRDLFSRFSSGNSINSANIFPSGSYPVYGGNGLRGYANIYNFDGECVIIGRQGAYCGNVKYFSGKGYMTEHAIVGVANKLNNTRFLFYKLSLRNLGKYAGQSAQPGLSVETLLDVDIDIPDKKTQDRIAYILSQIDEKIDNNNAIIAQLDEMAKLIYDYWFVQFDFPDENGRPYKSSGGKMVWNEELKREIPEGWEVCSYKNVLSIGNGKDHKSLSPGEYAVYGSGGLIRYVDSFLFHGESVLIPRKGTLNNIMYVKEKFWTVDTMFYTIMKVANIAKYMYYVTKQYNFISLNTGTGVPSMTSDIIYNLKLVLPPSNILKQFDFNIEKFFSMIKHCSSESKQLEHTRNFLLPLLMSGQVKISDIN